MSDVPPGALPDLIQYDDILKARDRIKSNVLRFPLVPLNFDWELGNVNINSFIFLDRFIRTQTCTFVVISTICGGPLLQTYMVNVLDLK